jgi:hypothetical protein
LEAETAAEPERAVVAAAVVVAKRLRSLVEGVAVVVAAVQLCLPALQESLPDLED